MRLILKIQTLVLPHRISPQEALELFHRDLLDRKPFLLMAKDWRLDPEDEDYEELTADELDDPYFLEDFMDATLEIW